MRGLPLSAVTTVAATSSRLIIDHLHAARQGAELENFIRNATVSHSHETCTAKMGRDALSVVDHDLRVYGLDGLRIADGSILPRVTTGDTMAACVVIVERASELLRAVYRY